MQNTLLKKKHNVNEIKSFKHSALSKFSFGIYQCFYAPSTNNICYPRNLTLP